MACSYQSGDGDQGAHHDRTDVEGLSAVVHDQAHGAAEEAAPAGPHENQHPVLCAGREHDVQDVDTLWTASGLHLLMSHLSMRFATSTAER